MRSRCLLGLACMLAAGLATVEPALAPVAAASATTAAAADATPTATPVEAFFRPPDLGQPKLSPSGRLLAVLSHPGGQRNALVVIDLNPGGGFKLAARFSDIDIDRFEWVNEERLVFDVIDREEGSGERRFAPGLFSVKPDGSELRQLVRLQHEWITGPRRIADRQLEWTHFLLHVPEGGGDEVIVGEWQLNNLNEVQSVVAKRLNVVSGRVRSISSDMPAHGTGWMFDAQGEPRLVTVRREGRARVHWRAPGQEAWVELANFDALKAGWAPRFIDGSGRLYVTVPEGRAGTTVLKRFDFEGLRPEAEAMVRTPGFDFVGSLVAETAGGRALGVRVETDAEQTVWFDARLKTVQAQIDAALPGLVNRLSCRRCDEPDMTVLVQSWSDRDPGQILVWRAADNKLQRVGVVNKEIEPRRMASRDFHRIRARDGRDLPLWLTQPAGPAPARPPPAVVMVHGGPWVRGGHWRFNPMAQFLASRGYVVIEPEFRGSAGFGAAHLQAGWRQWGRAMQDDVADAVLWAAKERRIDPARVCIIGASYGGYATLMGLVRHPELYRCGAAWVAVTDPTLLFKWSWRSDVSDDVRQYTLPVMLGDPVADAAMLQEVSPVAQAARIKAPLLLAFGGLDRRVPLEHGNTLRAAMRAAGSEPEWVVYSGEGHSWQLTASRVDFARRLEQFLGQHLP